MGMITQTDSVRVKVGNLSLLSGIRIISGNVVQAYDNDKNEWEPDRSLVPLVMLPYIEVSDPENVQGGAQALTGVEWYEGVPKKDFGNRIVAGKDYKIGDGTESGIPKYALVVMKNTPAGTAEDIYCIAKFTDSRVGQTRNVTLSVTLRASKYEASNYTLRLDCPIDVEIDPMRETQWLRTATAQLYCGKKAVDDAHAAYWWQTREGNGEWTDITADDGKLWADCMANGVYKKTLTYDAKMFEGVIFRVRAAYYDGKRPTQPTDAALKAEFMVNVRVRDSITAEMYKTKGLKMAYDFSDNVGFKVRVFDNAKEFDDDKVAEMTQVIWKAKSRKAGSQQVTLDSGVDMAFVPKDKGFDKAYGVDVMAEVKTYKKHVILTDDDGKYLTDDDGNVLIAPIFE